MRRIPRRAFDLPIWSLGTYNLAHRMEVNQDIPNELHAAADALRKALPQATFGGGLIFYELAFDDSPSGEVSPHVHLLLGSDCEWTGMQDGWHQALQRLGVDAPAKSIVPVYDRSGILHYSQKRWRDERPIPFERALQQMRVFEGAQVTSRFGTFRHPSRRKSSRGKAS